MQTRIKMKFLQRIVEHRVKKVPMTDILKDSFMAVGAVFGGAYGFANALHSRHGLVWKPTLGIMGGGAAGFTVGLFPFHALVLVLVGDVAHSVSRRT
jgi:hypothetical protein